jgi:hypothetical protein
VGAGVWFDTWGSTRHPTSDGRALEVTTGQVQGVMAFRFEGRDSAEQPIDAIACEFRLADREGQVWATTSQFTTRVFVTHMFDLAQGGEMDLFRLLPEGRRYKDVAKNNALEGYRQAFRTNVLLSDARFFSDDRGYRHLPVAGRLVRIKFKYLHLSFDVATSAGEGDKTDWFSVRIAPQCFWDDDRENTLGPLAFDIRCVHFLHHNTAVWDAVDERWRDNPLPLPLMFSPTGEEGKPQENVLVVG